MQKKKTNELYIVGLYVVTKEEYAEEKYIQTGKFLDWVATENRSDDHILDLIDVNSGTKYYGSGFEKGDLYVDYETLVSYTSLTNKNKLSIEEINYYLQKHKENDDEIKFKNKKMIYEIIIKIINELENEKVIEIINKIFEEYGEEQIELPQIIEKIRDTLDIKKEPKEKVRRR